MLILYHILASFLLLVLYPWLGNYTFLIMLSSIFIDLDHFQLVIKEKMYSAKKINSSLKNYLKAYKKKRDIKLLFHGQLFLFHSLEFVILLALLSFFYKPLLFISFGLLFHIAGDLIHHRRNGWPILRWLFLSYGIPIYIREIKNPTDKSLSDFSAR